MKRLKQFSIAILLSLAFTVSVPAGEIQIGKTPPPPPPPSSAVAVEPSDTSAGETQSPSESDSLITEITLAVLQLLTVL